MKKLRTDSFVTFHEKLCGWKMARKIGVGPNFKIVKNLEYIDP